MKMTALLILLGLCLATVSVADQQPARLPDADKLCEQMGSALVACIRDGKIDEGTKCDQILDTLLTHRDLRADNLFSAAQVARLRKQPQKAIAIVERILAEFPDAKFPQLAGSGRIVGQFWIASIASEGGDYPRAHAAYKELLQEAERLTDKRMASAMRVDVTLLQADLLANTGNKAEAIRLLRDRPAPPEPDYPSSDWCAYRLSCLENGVGPSLNALRQTKILKKQHDLLAASIVAMNGVAVDATPFPNGSGMYIYCLGMAAGKARKGIEAEAARLLLGVEYATRENDLPKAKATFAELSHSDSYLGPEAGLWQIRCLKKEQKAGIARADIAPLTQELKTRFPAYAPAIDECEKESVPERK